MSEKNLRKELEETKAEVEEYTNQLKRLQAEFENYIKREEREREQIVKCASERIILKLLDVVDDFERALKQLDENSRRGMEMIANNIKKALSEEGVRPIEAIGKQFDPYYHEVLMQEKTDKQEDGLILEELQKGYMLNDKVIRHTKIKIARR